MGVVLRERSREMANNNPYTKEMLKYDLETYISYLDKFIEEHDDENTDFYKGERCGFAEVLRMLNTL